MIQCAGFWYARWESCKYHGLKNPHPYGQRSQRRQRHTGCLCRRFSTAIGQARTRTPRRRVTQHRRVRDSPNGTCQPVKHTGTLEQDGRAACRTKNSGIPFHSRGCTCTSNKCPTCLSVNPWRITLLSASTSCTCQKPRHQPTVAPKNSAVRTMMKRPITPATNPPESRPAPGKLAA